MANPMNSWFILHNIHFNKLFLTKFEKVRAPSLISVLIDYEVRGESF